MQIPDSMHDDFAMTFILPYGDADSDDGANVLDDDTYASCDVDGDDQDDGGIRRCC